MNGGASMVYHVIDEGDVKRIMAHPMTMIASDGRLTRIGVDGGKFTAARPGRVPRHDQRGSAHTAGSSIPSTHTE